MTDITYIWVKDKWLYLATVMDLFSRSIIGWSLDLTMTEQLNTDALKMAFVRREIAPGLIIHSDRGVQYRAIKYQDLIRSKGGVVSMSRRGNCWDNAVMVSFYSRLKVELIYAEQYRSIDEAKSGIFEYIEVFITVYVGIQRWAMSVRLNMSALAHNQCLLFMGNTNLLELTLTEL